MEAGEASAGFEKLSYHVGKVSERTILRETAGEFLGAETSLADSQQVIGTSVLEPEGTEFCQQSLEFGKKKCGLANTLIISFKPCLDYRSFK